MTPKKRLILHLGLPRTGTTAIQHFLRRHDAELMMDGIWYPKFDPTQYVISDPTVEQAKARPVVANLSTDVYHLILAMAVGQSARNTKLSGIKIGLNVWNDFLEKFEDGPCHTAIISYEGFGAAPHNYNMDQLSQTLARFQFEGIIYHRRYDNWVKSLFEHNIRGKGRYKGECEDFIKIQNISLHPFSRRIELIRRNVPLNRIHVRSFDQAARADNLLEDFFTSLGLRETWLRIAPSRQRHQNASLRPSQSLVLQQLNRWEISDDTFVAISRAFARRAKRAPFDDPYSLLPTSVVARLKALTAVEADSLQELYGIVPPPPSTDGEPPRPHRLDRARFVEMIRAIEDTIGPSMRDEMLARSQDLEL